jgi:hypothetical protein
VPTPQVGSAAPKRTDAGPLLAEARLRSGGGRAPLAVYRVSGYRARKHAERPQGASFGGGTVRGGGLAFAPPARFDPTAHPSTLEPR